jgi:superfamily I DNA/RNA helicase
MAKKKKKDIEWSHYQLAIYDFIQNGQGNAVIEACAGSGKSTSLVKCLDFIGEDKRILITAFNKDIVNVLTKKTKNRTNVSSMTMHSLGLQMLRTNFRDKSLELDEFKYRSFVSTNLKKLTSIDTYALGKKDFLRYVDNICKYIDFGRYYLCQTVKDLDFIEDRYEIDTIADEKAVAIQSMEWGKRNLDTIDYTDMVWLPNMLNCQPYGLKFDWIAVDEAQDLNCAQRELLLKCRKISTRMLIFGDSDQCQPTGTKVMLTDGTEKNIEDLNVGDYVVTYNSEYGYYVGYKNYSVKGNITNQQCKRISAIEHHTENELITIETTSGKKSSYTPSHICYARMNREYSKTAYCTYVMRNDKGMYRIGKTKLYRNNYTFSLSHRLLSEGCIDAWILNIFETEKEARICELVNSYKFGIPQLVFDMERANNAEGRTPYFLNEEICEIYKQINENIEERVKRCLEYNHRKLEYPIVSRNKKNYISKEHFTTFNACNLFPKFMEVNTLNENNLREKHKYKIIRTPEKITNVKYSYGEFEVYSLDVEGNHNYVADGILTHNCLYSFSGSDPDSFNILKSLPNTISLPLSISYRCADNIVSYAKQLVPTIEENTEGRKGEIIENAKIEDVNDGDMIVCRNNAPLMKIYNSFIKEGKKCFVRGKDIGNNLKRIVKNTKKENLYKDLSKDGVFVRLYSNLFDARDTLMLNSNIDLDTAMQSSLIVNRLDTIKALEVLADGINTTDELIEKISNVFSDRKKNGISLSTIHKAKGLEADRVFVACKSLMPSKSAKKDWEIKQEYNLMYVAYTRAKNTLGFLDESYFDDIISDLPKEKKKLTAIEMQVNKVLGKKAKYISASTAYASEIVKRAGKLEMPKSNSKSLSKETKRVQVKPSLSGLFNRKITKRTLF